MTKTSNPSQSSVLVRLLHHLWPKTDRHLRQRIWLSAGCMGCARLFALVTPWFLGKAVDEIATVENTTFLIVAGLLISYVIARFFQVLFSELQSVLYTRVANRQIRLLALEIFSHLHKLPLAFHLDRQTGGLSQAIDRGAKSIEFMLSSVLYNLVPTLLELAAVCVIFWVLFGPIYALITLLTLTIYFIFTTKVTSWRIKFRREMLARDEATSSHAVDSLLNHETVKYFNAEQQEIDNYDNLLEKYEQSAVVSQYSLSLLNLGQAFLIAIGLSAIMFVATSDVLAETLTAGQLMTLNGYLLQILFPLNFLGTVYRLISQAIVDMERIFGLLDQKSTMTEPPDAPNLPKGNGPIEFHDVKIVMNNRVILDKINFTIPHGARYALVGKTGAGKTTIVRLLTRIIDPTSGSVKINGVNLQQVTQKSVRAISAIVPQDVILFNATLEYNIKYSSPTASTKQVNEAIKIAGLVEFIKDLPEGMQTLVGERGLKLSGGERQRMAIARAVLKQPQIFILDEATSALDMPTERKVKQALSAATANQTSLIVAHRLATVADCDHILFLANGKITEAGNHQQLLELNGDYRAAWNLQNINKKVN